MATIDYDYDVAFSYSGKDSEYVERVAARLLKKGVRIFFDKYEQVNLWGKDLFAELDDVYRRRSKCCVIFVSRHYLAGAWTSHERRSAQARALIEKREYLLPVRLDDTELPGLQPTLGYVRADHLTASALANLIIAKLSDLGALPEHLVQEKYVPGSSWRGVVRANDKTHLLVELEPAVIGFLPTSEISWIEHVPDSRKLLTSGQFIEPGEPIDVVVTKEPYGFGSPMRPRLTFRELESDPWNHEIAAAFHVGQSLRIQITRKVDRHWFAKVSPTLELRIVLREHEREIRHKHVLDTLPVPLRPRRVMTVRLCSIHAERRCLIVSIDPAETTQDGDFLVRRVRTYHWLGLDVPQLARLIAVREPFDCELYMRITGGEIECTNSIMDMLVRLAEVDGIHNGDLLEFRATGPQAKNALDAVVELIERNFDDPRQ